MPISIKEFVDQLAPERTVLILGAGASLPSGAPSVSDLINKISEDFAIDPTGLSLSEISGLAETKRSRQDLIASIRPKFKGLKAKGALLNLPLYGWKSIYSTNYDELVEDAYVRAGRSLKVFSSNFDFTAHTDPLAAKLLKIHGTIQKDISDGHQSRLIITDADYDATEDYREALYNRLRSDISPGSQVVIIGQSLADQDLRDVVQRAIAINQKSLNSGKIGLLLYQRDDNRALLFENRGLKVAFGGLDEFALELARKAPDHILVRNDTGSLLDLFPALRPSTREINDELDPEKADVSLIFNGWPANYADIACGLTFDRKIASDVDAFLQSDDKLVAVVLGASGVGKTTAARQVLLRLRGRNFNAWEHKSEHPLNKSAWVSVAEKLEKSGQKGVLLIDEAHAHLYDINDLIDLLSAASSLCLKVVIVSTRGHWGPRVKTPTIYAKGKEFYLSQLSGQEIDRLLDLVDAVPNLKNLVEAGFGGFSRNERRRRLVDRCEADMFVCMKNIFASEKYDDIILREFGALPVECQDVYRYVAAMEHAGIKVHRQLVMRILGIQANVLSGLLATLEDIITEYDVNSKEGVYGWRVRHHVIAGIIAKYKFFEVDKLIELFNLVIDNISPTFDIEIRTIRELCNIDAGLTVISDKRVQNNILRKMMSVAPGERVPRHRLIRNLIELGEFEKAESEIRIFEKDFGREAPVARYRVQLLIARAIETPGLMREDRIVILQQARELASAAADRYETNKYILGVYCELGVELFKITGSHAVFDEAMKVLKKAEARLGDPDVTKMVVRYQRRLTGASSDVDGIGYA